MPHAKEFHAEASPDEALWLFGTDVSDAFHQIPLAEDERWYTTAEFQGTIWMFNVLGFGSASAPTVWGRHAA